MISPQLCPACATPNPPGAPACRGCGAALGPPPSVTDQVAYESAPRPAAAGARGPGGAEGWPVLRLTPSLAPEAPADSWAGIPREKVAPPPAPPDWLKLRPGAFPPGSAGSPPPPPARPALSFHLDVGAGSALAAGPIPPAALPPTEGGLTVPRDGHPGADGSPARSVEAAAAPSASSPAGRGWGIRESRPARGPGWLLPRDGVTAAAAPPGVPAAPAPPAPAIAVAPPPWAPLAPPPARSHVGLGLLTLLIVLLAFGGGLWYLTYGPAGQGTGLGGGTHTVSAPSVLAGQVENTSPADQAALQSLRSGLEASLGSGSHAAITRTAVGLYGAAGSGGVAPDYVLFAVAANRQLTAADLGSAASGIAGDWSLASSSVRTQSGVSFHCGPLGNVPGFTTLCAWIDGNVLGVVLGAPAVGPSATLAAAERARGSAESAA